MDKIVKFNDLIPAVSCNGMSYEDAFDDGQITDKSLNSIYVVGSDIFGLGLLNAVHVLLAFVANSADPQKTRFSILDPGRSDYNDLLGSPFLNGDIITENDDILTILESASEIEFEFQNIIVLNQYGWLKKSLDDKYSKKIVKAVNKLVDSARKNNVIFIVVDRDVAYDEKIPDFDAVVCFRLADEALSRVVLGQPGAEKLKKHGDSLYLNRRTGELKHGQIPLLSSELFSNILRLP